MSYVYENPERSKAVPFSWAQQDHDIVYIFLREAAAKGRAPVLWRFWGLLLAWLATPRPVLQRLMQHVRSFEFWLGVVAGVVTRMGTKLAIEAAFAPAHGTTMATVAGIVACAGAGVGAAMVAHLVRTYYRNSKIPEGQVRQRYWGKPLLEVALVGLCGGMLGGGFANATGLVARVSGLAVGASTGVAIGLIHAGLNGFRSAHDARADLNWRALALQGAAFGTAGSIVGALSSDLLAAHSLMPISSAQAQSLAMASTPPLEAALAPSVPAPSLPRMDGGVSFHAPQPSSLAVAPIHSINVDGPSRLLPDSSFHGDHCSYPHHIVHHRHHVVHHTHHVTHPPVKAPPLPPIMEIIIQLPPSVPHPPMVVVPIMPPPQAVLPPVHVDPCADGYCGPICDQTSQLENHAMPVEISRAVPTIPLDNMTVSSALPEAAAAPVAVADAGAALNLQGPCANPDTQCVERVAFNDEGDATHAVLEPQAQGDVDGPHFEMQYGEATAEAGWKNAAQDMAANTVPVSDDARLSLVMPFNKQMASAGPAFA